MPSGVYKRIHFRPVEERLWEKVEKTDYCWNWLGSLNTSGYGHIGSNMKLLPTHRLSWTIHYGGIPEGMQVLHKCDNRRCLNPDHLFLGNNDINVADKVNKGRHCFGVQHPRHKLTESQVLEIKLLRSTGVKVGVIAEMFNVKQCTVSNILHGRMWKHLLIEKTP